MSEPTLYAWPPAAVAGTTTYVDLIGGGAGLPEDRGGANNIDCVTPRYASDKEPDANERYLILRWVDNRKPSASKEHIIPLGRIGPLPMTVKLTSLGIYRSRQWEIVLPSNVPLVLVSAEEEVEVLGS